MRSVMMARILLAFLVMGIGLLVARRLQDATRPGSDDGNAYRPRGSRAGKGGRFRQPPPYTARSVVRRSALGELRDALTGGPLDPADELFRCADCQSFYSVASVRALALDNGARCINCGSIHRIGVEVVD